MYDKSTLTVQQLTQAVTDSVVGYKDSAKQAAETVRPAPVLVSLPPVCCLLGAALIRKFILLRPAMPAGQLDALLSSLTAGTLAALYGWTLSQPHAASSWLGVATQHGAT